MMQLGAIPMTDDVGLLGHASLLRRPDPYGGQHPGDDRSVDTPPRSSAADEFGSAHLTCAGLSERSDVTRVSDGRPRPFTMARAPQGVSSHSGPSPDPPMKVK